eukprot:9226579-Lingulodinium_polyedra.AAC.1
MPPKELEDTGLLGSVHAFIVEPGRKTCRAGQGRCIDYFLVSECLRQHLLGCRVDEQGLTRPHWPVRLWLSGASTRQVVRVPVRQK